MAPSIENIINRSKGEIKEIEGKQAIAQLKREQIERRKAMPLEWASLQREKETLGKSVEDAFTRVDHEAEEITPLEQYLLCLDRTFKEINKLPESDSNLVIPGAFRFIALKLASDEDEKNAFYLGCMFASNQFEEKYPNLYKECRPNINGVKSDDITYWNETSSKDSWDPRDGEIQTLTESYTDAYERKISRDYIILSIPFSKESAIGVAVKEISESEFSDILD